MANNTAEYRFRNSTRNAMAAVITSIFMAVFNFVERTVFNQCFISDYLGFYSLFYNIISVLSVAELGLNVAIAYALYSPIAEDDYKEISVIMSYFRKVYAVIGAVILLAGLAVLPFLGYLVKTEVPISDIRTYFVLFLLGTVSEYFFYYKSIIFTASQNEYVNTLVTNISRSALYVVQIFISIKTRNFLLYSICILSYSIVRCIATNIIAKRKFPYLCVRSNRKLSKASRDKIVFNIRGLVLSQIGNVLVNITDSILISAMIGSAILGLYSNYQMITKGLLGFTRIFPNAITASLGNMGVMENENKMLDSYRAIDISFYLIYGILSIILFCIMNPIVQTFFGASRTLPLTSAFIISILFYASNIKSLYTTYKSSLGLYWYDRFRPVISGVTNVILSIILGKFIGFDGIVLGTFLTYLIIDLWVEPMIIFHHGFKTSSHAYIISTFARLLLVMALMAFTYFVTARIPFAGILGIIVKALASTAIAVGAFLMIYWKNEYARKAVHAIRHFIFKQEV